MGKGSDFERQVCRQLSLWWTDGEDADVFWRNRLRTTKFSPDAKNQLGDIAAMKPVGAPFTDKFCIELKTGYSKTKAGKKTKNIPWDVLDIIDGKEDGRKTLIEFWDQVKEDARLSYRSPMLIFKRDYHQPVMCINNTVMNELAVLTGSFWKDITCVSCESLQMFRLERFLERVSPEVVKLFK